MENHLGKQAHGSSWAIVRQCSPMLQIRWMPTTGWRLWVRCSLQLRVMTGRRSCLLLDDSRVLTDKRHIHLRSASVQTYTFFTTEFSRFLSIRGARGLQAFDLPLHTSYSNPNYDWTRKLLNYTRENDQAIKIGDTRPWVYDTRTCNRFEQETQSNLSRVVTTVSPFPSSRTVTTRRYSWLVLWWKRRIEWIQGSIGALLPLRNGS
jgi:hypothetical protein